MPKHPEPLSDPQLIEGCLRNDSGSWEALIRRYQNLIYSVPIKYRFSLQDSSDIFQSVCLILMEKLKTLRNTETLASWLYTTTRRQCWKFARKRSREVELEDQAGGAEDPTGDRLVLQHQLKSGLEQLSGKCRDLLTALILPNRPSPTTRSWSGWRSVGQYWPHSGTVSGASEEVDDKKMTIKVRHFLYHFSLIPALTRMRSTEV